MGFFSDIWSGVKDVVAAVAEPVAQAAGTYFGGPEAGKVAGNIAKNLAPHPSGWSPPSNAPITYPNALNLTGSQSGIYQGTGIMDETQTAPQANQGAVNPQIIAIPAPATNNTNLILVMGLGLAALFFFKRGR